MEVRFAAKAGGMLPALALILLALPAEAAGPPPDMEAYQRLVKRQIDEGDYEGAVETLGKMLVWSRTAQAEKKERETTDEASRRTAPGTAFQDPLRSGGTGPQMVVLPAGAFRMGCLSEDDCSHHELPAHFVRVAHSFAVSAHEVTFEDYDRFRPNEADDAGWGRGRRPVINVSWDDAKSYANWLSSQTGAEYRLLSESEWEYAARAGTTTKYSWGDWIGGNNLANCTGAMIFDDHGLGVDVPGCGSRWDGKQAAPVGSFEPNGFGLYDMHGNVSEWVEDCWNKNYHGAPDDGSSWLQGECRYRVLRGGSWSNAPGNLRSAHRSEDTAGSRSNNVGFRVARALAP